MCKSGNRKRILMGAGAFGLLLLFLIDTKGVADGSLAALGIFAHGVLPATFPYLLLSEIIVSTGFAEALGRRCGKTSGQIFSLPPAAVSVILMGLVSGFPVGAKSAADLYRAGYIDRRDAERLSAFTDFCGPPFLFLTVGQGLFGDVRVGILLYLSQSVTALLFGMLYKRKKKKRATHSSVFLPPKPFSRIFTDAVSNAALSALKILGYLIFFKAVCCVSEDLLAHVFPPSASKAIAALFSGILEISAGSAALKTLQSPTVRLLLAALVTGWSGLSVSLQVSGFLKEADIPMKGYLLAHLICPPVSAAIAVGVGILTGII